MSGESLGNLGVSLDVRGSFKSQNDSNFRWLYPMWDLSESKSDSNFRWLYPMWDLSESKSDQRG